MEEAKATCPTCNSVFPAGATFCPKCGYVVPETAPPAEPQVTPPAPQPNVVYVQPPVVVERESNWGAWLGLAVAIVLIVGGVLLWSSGYLGTASPTSTPPSTVTIENSPQMTSEVPQEPAAEPATPAPAPAPAEEQPATTPAEPPAAMPEIDVISVSGKPLETNSIEWKYGYTLKLRNNTASVITANLRVQFLDKDGFAVDDDVVEGLQIPANSEITVEGDDLIQASLAVRIRTLFAEVR